MFHLFQTATLVAATIMTGLTAGLLYAFAHAVMPGLARRDDRTFIGAFQGMDQAIINPWFFVGFLGAPGFTALAAVLSLTKDTRSVLPWVAAALVLYLATIVITMAINVPLNNQLAAAGEPDSMVDPAGVRERFEGRWVRWNVVRTATSAAGFTCLCCALVVFGRTV